MAANAHWPTPLTREWVTQKGVEWQSRLRLLNWVIFFKLATKDELPSQEWGINVTYQNQLVSHISVRSDVTKDEEEALYFDPEVVIVHELLHLVLNPLRLTNARAVEEEQVIENLSHALVGAVRGHFTSALFVIP